jgi:hypothetical protein
LNLFQMVSRNKEPVHADDLYSAANVDLKNYDAADQEIAYDKGEIPSPLGSLPTVPHVEL